MERVKQSLEALDEAVFGLEDRFGSSIQAMRDAARKHNEVIKESRSREANALGLAQKVALRLDQAIEHVERVLGD
jgi:translation initiation factor 2 alpha subunit (eIF-2alpha)